MSAATSFFAKAADLWPEIINGAKQLTPFLPTYAHLLAAALFPIYVGAHASLSAPSSAAPKPKRKKEKREESEDDDEDDEDIEVKAVDMEGFTPQDAILFPLLAGITLSSLYFLLKWLKDPAILNKILNYYFMNVGVVMGTRFIKDTLAVTRSFCFPMQYSKDGWVFKADHAKKRYASVADPETRLRVRTDSPLSGSLGALLASRSIANQVWAFRSFIYAKCTLNLRIHKLLQVKMPIEALDVISLVSAVALVVINNYLGQKWYLSNIIGTAFCYGSGQYMSPTTFWTGTLILGALFLYDIYFVFFTPIMVTVATKLEVPIKLLFPRPSSADEVSKGLQGLAMLGLGDIVIPGMMIALALRFDLFLHYLKQARTIDGKSVKPEYSPVTGGWGERFWVSKNLFGRDLRAKSFPKPYFYAGLVGYVMGMAATVVIMQTTSHAQPALLYLVPGVLISLWGTALVKQELDLMWGFMEGEKEATGAEKEVHDSTKKILADGIEHNRAGKAGQLKTNPSAQSEKSDDKEDGHIPKSAAEDARHLIWFSIDFPRPPSKPRDKSKKVTDGENGQIEDAALVRDG